MAAGPYYLLITGVQADLGDIISGSHGSHGGDWGWVSVSVAGCCLLVVVACQGRYPFCEMCVKKCTYLSRIDELTTVLGRT